MVAIVLVCSLCLVLICVILVMVWCRCVLVVCSEVLVVRVCFISLFSLGFW